MIKKELSSENLKSIFGSSNRIKKHRILSIPYRIGKYHRNKLIDYEDLKGSSIWTSQVCDYLVEVEKIDVVFIKKEMARNLQRKNKKDLPPLPRVKAIDIWQYQIDKFHAGEIKVKVKAFSSELPTENYVELPESFRIVCVEEGWEEEFETFRRKIPNTPEIKSLLDKFFKDVAFGEGDKSNWKYTWKDYLEKFEAVPGVREFCSNDNKSWGGPWGGNRAFFEEMFNLNCDGLGKSEIMMAFLIKGASIMGGKEPFDLLIENDTIRREIYELKAMGCNGSIRLGKAKLPRYKFHDHVNNVLHSMTRLDKQISDDAKAEFLSPELIASWRWGLDEFQSAWSEGETGEDKLRRFIMFLYYMHEYIQSRKVINYTTAVITLTDNKVSESFTAPIKNKAYYHSNKDALLEFGALRYIVDPELLMKDLNDTITDYFSHHIDYFAIFRFGYKINICKPEDLVFDTITQGGVKIVEQSLSTKIRVNYDENKAFKKWKKNPSKSFEWYYQKELLK